MDPRRATQAYPVSPKAGRPDGLRPLGDMRGAEGPVGRQRSRSRPVRLRRQAGGREAVRKAVGALCPPIGLTSTAATSSSAGVSMVVRTTVRKAYVALALHRTHACTPPAAASLCAATEHSRSGWNDEAPVGERSSRQHGDAPQAARVRLRDLQVG